MACIPTAATTTGVARIVNQAAGLISIPNCCNTKTVTNHPTFSFSSKISFSSLGNRGIGGLVVVSAADSMATEIFGIKIVKNPPESKLSDLGVRSWPKWGCPPSRFPWTYSDKETCYLLKGKVKVYPEGSDEGVEFGAGDLVEFPQGYELHLGCFEAVDKHYKFEWGCPPSRFPWTYSDKETCYLLKGKVKVYPEGSDEGVEFGAGDLVEFPKGMSCTWDVLEAVDKHYKFE